MRSRSMIGARIRLLVVGYRIVVAVGTALRPLGMGCGRMRIMECQGTVADMIVRAGGRTGQRVVSGLMQEPVVRQRVVPVTVIPEPVGMALCQSGAVVRVDGVGDVVVAPQ